jgi:selenocysteine lyase/cysteine desulfurase
VDHYIYVLLSQQKMNRSTFLKSLAVLPVATQQFVFNQKKQKSMQQLAQDEAFWLKIREEFEVNPAYINLENGYYCLMPKRTLQAAQANMKRINFEASRYMRTEQFNDKQAVANRLNKLVGGEGGQLIVTRNTTESLDTVINGQNWQSGDEAVMAVQDYGAMLDMFKLMERRHGIVRKVVSLPNHPLSDEEIVELYAAAITSKTKLLMVCHMVNVTGQILPVKKIAAMAHAKNVKVMVDGAHCVGHFMFNLKDLNVDYYATSLHKWMSVPLGAGFLWVKNENIESLWPLFGDEGFGNKDVRKLNHTGTHPVHTDLSINAAIDFHEQLGAELKEARLRYLQNYWNTRLQGIENVVINTPMGQKSCGIGNVGLKNLSPSVLAQKLFEQHKIWTVAIDFENVHGVRVTPHLYTTVNELDAFVEAIKALSSQ